MIYLITKTGGIGMGSNFDKVLHYFYEINKIPRCSGEEQKISDYLLDFARKRGLEAERDECLNVLIRKNGTAGMENAPAVILQGHMDMVCVARSGLDIDFSKDNIKTVREGNILRAEGTSLGADNGLAIAYMLALLDSDDICHPPLEVLMTAGEEIGLIGASKLSIPDITGKTLINLDSEEEGLIYAGCAGGANTSLVLDIERDSLIDVKDDMPRASGTQDRVYKIRISGLIGGHSGLEIHKQRANAIKLMARLLEDLENLLLLDFKGGSKNNAIPVEAEATLLADDPKVIEKAIDRWQRVFRNEHRQSDPDLKVELFPIPVSSSEMLRPMKEESARKLIDILLLLPNGVQTVSKDIEGLVQSSNNIGVITSEADKVRIDCAPRSSVDSLKKEIILRIMKTGEAFGAKAISEYDYPEWEYAPKSKIRDLFIKVYEELYGRKPTVATIHAGLECGALGKKLKDLDMISVGPDIKGAHTINERLDLDSAERTFTLLVEVLKRFK